MEGFATVLGRDEALARAARVAVEDVLAVKPGERVLIVTNPVPDVLRISGALYDAAGAVGGLSVMVVQPVRGQLDLALDEVIAAIGANPEVVISVSHEKLGKDAKGLREPYEWDGKRYDHVFTHLLSSGRIRAFWSPGVTAEMFSRTVPLDYPALRQRAKALSEALNEADEVWITAPGGTDLVVGLRGRKAKLDDGDFTERGKGGNLPCGEVFVSPELGSSRGLLVFDGSISVSEGVILISEPIRAEVEEGHVVRLSGGEEARRLQETLDKARDTTRGFASSGRIPPDKEEVYLRNVTNLGELGIGLNPAARICGNMLEDEKVLTTCHLAIGANYDEDAPALIHLDGLVKHPTIVARGPGGERTLMRDGALLVGG